MITTERLHELAAIAEAATPGPWRRSPHIDFPSETGYEVYLPPADGGPYGTGGRVGEASTKMDAAHIAAFDPTTARALIAEVLALREVAEVKAR